MTTSIQTFSRTALAMALMGATSAFAANNVDVSVNLETHTNGNVSAVVQFTNQSNHTQKLLSWYTDLEEEHIFKVTRDGEEVAFNGPHFKRPAPTENDYITLNAGESMTKTFELTGFYDFSQPGNYEVSYNVHSLNLFQQPTLMPIDSKLHTTSSRSNANVSTLKSESVSVWINGMGLKMDNMRTAAKPTAAAGDCVDGTCFTGRCDNGQKNDILSALNAADQMANSSVSYLNSHSSSSASARYTTWFGSSSSSRYNTVSDHFDAINDAIDNKPLTFDCSCKKSYFAYVYPNQPYKVYLCRAFWSANESGTDSRGGTIIHELSHFNAVAGTDDIVYGQSGAKSLAISNPSQAIQNADSHEYFAENTPYQN
ncbi:M35 family metallo-endopeptidase [Pseudoalteromonas xiamenensis]|uniref:Peptidase M35 n=1 Tax=Pseudoalteromonas xiamenensis TaxID=882626 RepID=A0A975HMR9_9GAMM|nr:M35 family metallo-endopeptidase [Pseudoalteromonas xiamenensis]QTH73403.1 peptidase M35 [Pseudoalteromonas xiamenensis]